MNVKKTQLLEELRLLVAENEPTGADDPECSECGDGVYVEYGYEWNDGDMCHDCTDACYRALKEKVRELLAIESATPA